MKEFKLAKFFHRQELNCYLNKTQRFTAIKKFLHIHLILKKNMNKSNICLINSFTKAWKTTWSKWELILQSRQIEDKDNSKQYKLLSKKILKKTP